MNDLEHMLTSNEVCKMIGKRHDNLLRDIENYISDFTYLKIEVSEYFIRSSYRDRSGKENKCFKITKKGCEFLAHKLKGQKGTEFTLRYIDCFHKMENIIKSGIMETPEKEPPRQGPDHALPEIPKFRGNHIDHKEKAALFVMQYIDENGDSSGVYRAYRNNQAGNCDVILPYSFFRRVQIKVEEMIYNKSIKQIEA